MIDNFLRPPGSRGQKTADALRLLGVLSAVAALALPGFTDAAIIAFCLPGLMLPRFLGMRPAADAWVTVVLLVAAWSNVLDLYRTVEWWDIPVHVVVAGTVAVLVYLLLARTEIVPAPGTARFTAVGALVLTTVLGLALGAVWEMVEWFGYAVITDDIHVTYQDTVGDMAAGGLGAVVGGWLLGRAPQLLIPTARPTSVSSPNTSSR
ncbi:hypothetical protein [Dietzia aerolata]|uniref:DUF2238 domain-containing protein n=1 Tax=Dietzia aerolata TaxID=595984 RepID=A0ABV5JS90_9ACTN